MRSAYLWQSGSLTFMSSSSSAAYSFSELVIRHWISPYTFSKSSTLSPFLPSKTLREKLEAKPYIKFDYRGLFDSLVKFLLDLGPLVLVCALKKRQEVDAASDHFAFNKAVHELLEAEGAKLQVLFVERSLRGLVSHGRYLVM